LGDHRRRDLDEFDFKPVRLGETSYKKLSPDSSLADGVRFGFPRDQNNKGRFHFLHCADLFVRVYFPIPESMAGLPLARSNTSSQGQCGKKQIFAAQQSRTIASGQDPRRAHGSGFA